MTRIPAFFTALMLPALAYADLASERIDTVSFQDVTYLIELRQGSALSSLVHGLGSGEFETATGNRVNFLPWYSSRWTDASITWMTQISPNFAVIHGLSTGERGPKYTIAPALKLGVMMQAKTGHQSFLTLRATTTIGGELTEKPCSADYGGVGGVQVVNCRLAATSLPPAQTLAYLLQEQPPHRHQVNVIFTWKF